MYEGCLDSQLYHYFDKVFFSKCQCDLRKYFSTQQALVGMIEKMKTSRDSKEFCKAILMD